MRVTTIDALRGISIIMMVAYHIIFDLKYFGFFAIDLNALPLVIFQRIIGLSFLTLVGISLTLSEKNNTQDYLRHFRRAAILGSIALLITLATWIYPHQGFITFGIIHLIALSTIIAPFFFNRGKFNLVLAVIVIVLGLFFSSIVISQNYLFWLGLVYPGYEALDYYPLFPWFAFVLIGIYIGETVKLLPEWKGFLAEGFAFLGRNSLTIYLLHQPIIIGIMLLILNGPGEI